MQDEITKYDTTTTTTNNDSICNNDNSERMHSAFDGQVENEDREPCAFEWGEEVEESIKAEFKTPTELAAAYNDLKSRVLPPEDGKYGYDGKSIALEYIDMMEGMMKDCKISKGQGADLLRSVEEMERQKLESNCIELAKVYGSEGELIEKLEQNLHHWPWPWPWPSADRI